MSTTGAKVLNSAVVVTALVLIGSAVAFAKGQRRARARTPEQQIRAVLDQQVEAWNRGDLESFMQGYWNSEKLSFFSVRKAGGWQATLEGYRQRYQGEGKEMGKLDFSELEIEMLGPRAGFVRGHWRLKLTSGEVGGLFTLVFKKFPEGWKIVHDHTSSS